MISPKVQAPEFRTIASQLRAQAAAGGGVVEYSFNNKRVRKESIKDLLAAAADLDRQADILEGYYRADLSSTQLVWRR